MKTMYKLSLGLLLAASMGNVYAANTATCNPAANVVESIVTGVPDQFSNLEFSNSLGSVSAAVEQPYCIGGQFPTQLSGAFKNQKFVITSIAPLQPGNNVSKLSIERVQAYKAGGSLGSVIDPTDSSFAFVVQQYGY